MRDVLATSADDARAEHTLELILDAQGKADEAGRHYARAAQLDPNNETYRLSCQLAAGAALGGPAPAVAARSTGKVVQPASATEPAAEDAAAVHDATSALPPETRPPKRPSPEPQPVVRRFPQDASRPTSAK